MSRHIAPVALVSLLQIAGALSALGEEGPKAVLLEAVHDFGELHRGERVSTTFVVENRGDADLVIDRVASTCACLITEYEERIPPRGKGEIVAELDTLTVQGPSATFVRVSTNDPENPSLELTVKATVNNVIEAAPGYLQYQVVQGFAGRAAIGQVLWDPNGTPFSITRIESPSPFLSVTHREATDEERERLAPDADPDGVFYWVEAVLSADAPVGPLGGYLKIHVDHPEQSLVPLPVSGFMRPVFAVTPHEAHFGELSIGEDGLTQGFFVKNFATETIPITDVETDVEGLEVEIEETKEGRTWLVTLAFPPTMTKGPFSGKLRIHTSSERAPLVEVPLSGTILEDTPQ